MPADSPGPRQSYANHAHRPIAWQIAFVLATVAAGLLIAAAIDERSMAAAAVALLGVSTLLLLVVQRRATLKLQNRIIRLEMQARLTRLGRAADLARLSPRQLIALRFAADAEMPALIERAVAEQLTGDQIKRAIADWQPDLFQDLSGEPEPMQPLMTPEDRQEVLKILEAHAQTVAICEACATTTRDLAAEVGRGGTPARDDLIQTVAAAEQVLHDLAGTREEIERLIAALR